MLGQFKWSLAATILAFCFLVFDSGMTISLQSRYSSGTLNADAALRSFYAG